MYVILLFLLHLGEHVEHHGCQVALGLGTL